MPMNGCSFLSVYQRLEIVRISLISQVKTAMFHCN
uniref:Uncharacterized protein n=1 Tax=Arundo donax TaxID=35708 RepID=A0A0A9ACX2_ARUDO